MADFDVSGAQRAIGFLAARRRGDEEDAQHLLTQFRSDADRAMGFCVVADLALLLLSQACDESFDDIAQRSSLTLALMESRAP